MSFNPMRLSIARKRRLLNKKRFAELAGVAVHTVIRCEKGGTDPTPENAAIFASVLGFPIGFFYGEDLDEPLAASFRSQTSMSAAIRDASLAAGSLGFTVSDWVEQRFSLPEIQIPDLHLYEPEGAARVPGTELRRGDAPMSTMRHVLES